VGIVTDTSVCGDANYPNIYTRLAYYGNWIASIQNQSDATVPTPAIVYACKKESATCGCGYNDVGFSTARLTGGQEAVPFSWSMIVSIRFSLFDKHSCGGSILDASHILTSAHCVKDESPTTPDEVFIVAGMHNRFSNEETSREVDRIFMYPLWDMNASGYLNDIAILHLSVPLNFNDDPFVFPSCIPQIKSSTLMSQYPCNGSRLVTIGWGSTGLDSDLLAGNLQQVHLNVIDNAHPSCRSMISDAEKQFCAGSFEGGKGQS
jgi:hypothetical protein